MSGRDFTSVWRASARPDQLVRTAITLLVDRGLPDSSIDVIAAQAGLAKGSFHHYFASKADLRDALRLHFSDAFQTRVVAAGQADGAWHLSGETPVQVAAFIFHALRGMADDALTAGRSADELGARTAQLSRRVPGS